MRAPDYVETLAARGRPCFSQEDAQRALSSSGPALRAALRRLVQKGELARPVRGFYVIVPPELRSVGCLPPEEFVPHLMEHLDRSYYAGLLTAAELHGAAHQHPQAFQVISSSWSREIVCGRSRVRFTARANVRDIPVVTINTPRSRLAVSTPEVTAFDLVGHPRQSGGLDNVATVLAELAEKIDPRKLAAAAPLSPLAWSQRLGFLLEHLGFGTLTGPLHTHMARQSAKLVGLAVGPPLAGTSRDRRWSVALNAAIEADVDT